MDTIADACSAIFGVVVCENVGRDVNEDVVNGDDEDIEDSEDADNLTDFIDVDVDDILDASDAIELYERDVDDIDDIDDRDIDTRERDMALPRPLKWALIVIYNIYNI